MRHERLRREPFIRIRGAHEGLVQPALLAELLLIQQLVLHELRRRPQRASEDLAVSRYLLGRLYQSRTRVARQRVSSIIADADPQVDGYSTRELSSPFYLALAPGLAFRLLRLVLPEDAKHGVAAAELF